MEFNLSTLSGHATLLLLTKAGIIAILFFFSIFLVVLLKQLRSMNETITQPNHFPFLHQFTILMLGITVVLFVASIVIL